ncbi:chemotaxis protein CheR [Lysinibacillus sp. 2017]|uniref:CheR family methyltransferase n=1 Tax=unclassified Lysinibacillus TaxID=2636778 RepID=UPI000D529837|nr:MULTISPECIES: protein-glutamate O-methyltransferase CheR [unclassified Lysinibacillus]AWE08548.1 chemotaxis protein CheR [Lysinibacillus sp. 2017]TGN35639.1 protein-glutamate O-methyltransferase CheR [Lysinibacillus sp. S2017]
MDKKQLEIRLLLEAVFTLSGFDFRKYNQQSILRRVEHRMRINNFPTISRLTEGIIYDEQLLNMLLNDFSINVTEMFRDPSFFKVFRQQVVPQFQQLDKLRVWHAGCATGEEVYSMAILLQEEGLLEKTVMYATDMNENVLKKAQQGAFPLHKMQAYTKNYILAGGTESFSQYYKTDDCYASFHSYLRENIIFAQHNLATDQSFQEFDIIICRNVLIYFTPELQHNVHHLFYDSLAQHGFLGLGDKETLQFSPLASKYHIVNATERIYQKKL